MSDRRGLHFLTGLATLWMLWRLYASGWLDQVIYSAMPVESGPGAVIVGLIVEAVITVGMLAVLVASGLWDLAMVTGRMIGDALGVARSYAIELRPARQRTQAPAAVASGDAEAAVGPSDTTSPVVQQSTGDPVKDAIVLLSQQQVEIATGQQQLREDLKKAGVLPNE